MAGTHGKKAKEILVHITKYDTLAWYLLSRNKKLSYEF
jgi:hypothetical protein